MKREDNNKTEWLLRMHEHAEQLSDDDMQTLLDSADKDDDINTLSAIKRAMARGRASLSDDEIDNQWEAFEAELSAKEERRKNAAGRSWLKIAAMFVGVVMIAGVAFAAIQMIVSHQNKAVMHTKTTLTADRKSSMTTANKTEVSDSLATAAADSVNIVRFDDVELQTILTVVADYHHLTLQYENEESKHIKMFFKWDKHANVTAIVEILNSYDRINIEQSGNVLIIR